MERQKLENEEPGGGSAHGTVQGVPWSFPGARAREKGSQGCGDGEVMTPRRGGRTICKVKHKVVPRRRLSQQTYEGKRPKSRGRRRHLGKKPSHQDGPIQKKKEKERSGQGHLHILFFL